MIKKLIIILLAMAQYNLIEALTDGQRLGLITEIVNESQGNNDKIDFIEAREIYRQIVADGIAKKAMKKIGDKWDSSPDFGASAKADELKKLPRYPQLTEDPKTADAKIGAATLQVFEDKDISRLIKNTAKLDVVKAGTTTSVLK